MKFAAIFLIACVAVSQAAFTSNLRQHVQPALSQAMFQVRLVSRGDELQTGLALQLQATIDGLLNQASSAIQSGQAIAQGITQQLSDAYAALQALGSNVVENGQGILGQLVSGLGNIWSSIFGKSGKLDIVAILGSAWEAAQNFLNQMDLQSLLQLAAQGLLNNWLGGRGLFSDAWNAISSGAGQAWAGLQNIFNNVTATAGTAFNQVQALAQSFLNDAISEATTITSDAATQLLNFLKPYQHDLGALYNQVAQQVSQLIGH